MATRLVNGRRPKNKRVERALLKREPKVHENVKTAMFIRGPKTSETINAALSDLHSLKRPDGIKFNKRNGVRPFEDQSSLEFFAGKNDSSLLCYGSHQKKRPNNLVLARFFDHQLLDMIELGITNYKGIHEFGSTQSPALGSKPCFIFRGPEFEQKEDFKKLSNMLLDFYRGEVTDQINLAGLDHVITCTAVEDKIYFRHYYIKLKKSGASLPRVELEEIGPAMDLTIRRTRFASFDLMKSALRQPKQLKTKKVKNVSHNVFGTIINVHKGSQDLNKLQTRKMKGLKRKRAEDDKSSEGQKGDTAEKNDEGATPSNSKRERPLDS